MSTTLHIAVTLANAAANIVLLIAWLVARDRAAQYAFMLRAAVEDIRKLDRQLQGSVRRDPKTGRYLKKGR